MPPKVKKSKVKKTKVTKTSQNVRQTVNIKIGNDTKPKRTYRKRAAPTQPKDDHKRYNSLVPQVIPQQTDHQAYLEVIKSLLPKEKAKPVMERQQSFMDDMNAEPRDFFTPRTEDPRRDMMDRLNLPRDNLRKNLNL